MKKIYLLLLSTTLMLQSCVTKEEIHVKNNGEVEYKFNMDFSEMMSSVPDKKALFKGDADKVEMFNGHDFTVDQLLDIALLKEKNAQHKKDSIVKANKELFDNTKNIRFMVNMNDTVSDFNIKVLAKDIADLNQSLININKVTETASKIDKSKDSKTPPILLDSKYSLSSKSFERKILAEKKEDQESSTGGMEAMFTYILKTTFDKKIKSVSYEDAVISEDGKSFEKKFSVAEIMKNPKVLEYKVDFK